MADENGTDETRRLDFDSHDAPTVTPAIPRRTASGRAVFEPGHVVAGRYRIIRFIARGGMGEVFEAEDLELHGSVALKTIRPEIADDEIAIGRFRREIQIARKVTHPNVCRVFDVDHDQSTGTDVMFVTMEMLIGQTLREAVVKNGPMTTSAALPIARQMADGLAAAHRAGVIHRDFKSANVMLVDEPGRGEPRVVVTDFGLARAAVVSEHSVTNTGDIVGSPAYMSPEQIEGKPLTPATDIYALGVVLYEMVTRGHPFEAETPLHSVLKRLHEPPTSPRTYVPDLDPAWEHAILRCLERQPADRYPDAPSVARALEGAPSGTLPSRRRARMRWAAIAVACIAVVAALAMFVPWQRERVVAPQSARVVPARRAVAVLGFTNQSRQQDVAWLSTALTEMLTTEVAAAEQVRTIPGETVARTRRELGLVDDAPLAGPALARLRGVLGSDYVISGSYAALGPAGSRQLRIDVQLQEALGGNVVAAFAETGTEEKIFELVSRSGSRLREKLGATSVSPEAASGILASLPSNAKAVRYYAEGLTAMRAYDNLRARELLEKAIAEDPDFPLAHSALAGVWRALGYEARARQEADAALKRAAGLPRESRLVIEAQAHAEHDRYLQAAEIYQALSRFYPDDLDYALRTSSARVYGGEPKEALALIESLKKTWRDPRVDLAEAEAAETASEYPRSRAAATRAIKAADARGLRLLAARARIMEGWALLRMSQLPAARVAFEDARTRYEKAGDRAGVGQALGGLGAVLYDAEELDEAMRVFADELRIAQETGSRQRQAADLHNIAMVQYKKGDLTTAKATLRRAMEIELDRGDKIGYAGTVAMIAGVESDAGNLTEAARLYEQALAINEEIGAAHAAANNRNNMGSIRKAKGDLDGATKLFEEAMAGFRATHDDAAVADVLNNIAVIHQSRGDLAAAEKSYREAEQVYTRLKSESDLAMVAVNVSPILIERGDLPAAKQKAERALAIWRGTGEKSYAAYAMMAVGDVESRRGDLARAERIFQEALQARQEMGEASTVAESQLALSDLALEQKRVADAERLARAALATFEKEDRKDVMAVARAILCDVAIERRDLRAAQKLLQEAGSLASSSGEASAQFTVALTETKLATALGKPAIAVSRATTLLEDAKRTGSIAKQFEARLAIAEAQLAAGRSAEARAQLDVLEWDAGQRGFGLIAQKVRAMKAGAPKA